MTHLLTLAALAAALLALAGPAAAQSSVADAPSASSGFTFKKISPPAPGATRRITVQIDPDEVRPPPPKPAPVINGRPDDAPKLVDPVLTAFWDATGTGLADAGPGRFLDASDFLAGPVAAALPAPSLTALQALTQAHGRTILASTIGTRVSPALVLSVMVTESSGRSEVVSSAGAQGLMQLIPATAERFGVEDPFDPAQNIAGGVRYLDWLMDRFSGDAILALAGYNAGENAVKGAGGVPDYAETRAYVPKVLAAWRVARSLCATPPDLASDGCVFTTMATN